MWDYHSKSCVQTLEGHTNNVSFAILHSNLPLIISGSEDGTIKLWNSGTYRLETTLSYALERAWCIAVRQRANDVAFGYDGGLVAMKLGRDAPSLSMDRPGTHLCSQHGRPISEATDHRGCRDPRRPAHSLFDTRDWVDGDIRNFSPALAQWTMHHCRQRWRVHHIHGAGVEKQSVWDRILLRLVE